MEKEIKQDQIGNRLGDISDLPESLRKLLRTTRLDDLEDKIIKTMNGRYAGSASIDEIIVGLYRDFEFLTEDRRALSNKLYRMAKAGHIESIPKRKGIFKVK
jgi:hypothetical protein